MHDCFLGDRPTEAPEPRGIRTRPFLQPHDSQAVTILEHVGERLAGLGRSNPGVREQPVILIRSLLLPQ